MSRLVCHLERDAGGFVVRRVRLLGPALEETWEAPPPPTGDAEGDEAHLPARAWAQDAAAWLAQRVRAAMPRQAPRIDLISIDATGGVCSWMGASAASEARLLEATIRHAEAAIAGSGPGGGGDGANLPNAGESAAAVLAGAGLTGDGLDATRTRSVQALGSTGRSEAHNSDGASVGLLEKARAALGRTEDQRPQEQEQPAGPERVAVVALLDTPVRVLIDELDRLGVEVGRVASAWHVMAEAWDAPATTPAGAASAPGFDDDPARFVSTGSETTAVVMIQPEGRLVWCWSRDAGVIAAGTMRLRVREIAAPAAPTDDQAIELPGARRIAQPATTMVVEWSRRDAGRLASDWLAWSVQTGASPTRALCLSPELAPPELTDEPLSLAGGVAAAWPGCAADGVEVGDPVGATLRRLVAAAEPEGEEPDPTRSLVGLSARPSKAHRQMFVWAAAAICATAVLIASGGIVLRRAADDAEAQAAALTTKRSETLDRLAIIDPRVRSHPDPLGILLQAQEDRKATAEQIVREPPSLDELQRVLAAIAPDRENVKIDELAVNNFGGLVKLRVADIGTGTAIAERLMSSEGRMDWQGQTPGRGTVQGMRQYQLNGTWPAADRGPGGAPRGGRS